MLNTFVQKMRDYNFIVDEDKPAQIEFSKLEKKIKKLHAFATIGLFVAILSPIIGSALHVVSVFVGSLVMLFLFINVGFTFFVMKKEKKLNTIKNNFFNKDNQALVKYFSQPEIMVEAYKIIKENGCATEELLQDYFSRFYESLTEDDDFKEQTAALFDILSLLLKVEDKISNHRIDTDLFLQHLAEGTLTSENMKTSTHAAVQISDTKSDKGQSASLNTTSMAATLMPSSDNLDKHITLDKPGYLYAK